MPSSGEVLINGINIHERDNEILLKELDEKYCHSAPEIIST